MGEASHRFENARGHLQTCLSPYRVAEIAHAQSPPTPTPEIRYEGAGDGFLQFSVRRWGVIQDMAFVVQIASSPHGCEVTTDIQAFTTSQQVMYGFIPAGRKQLLGYKKYRKFFESLARQVVAEDPSARSMFSEAG